VRAPFGFTAGDKFMDVVVHHGAHICANAAVVDSIKDQLKMIPPHLRRVRPRPTSRLADIDQCVGNPHTSPLATAEFATIRERLIKIGARVIEHIARIRIQLPTSCPEGGVVQSRRARPAAVRSMSRRAACPDEPPTGKSTPDLLHSELPHTVPAGQKCRTPFQPVR
jgi:hypothetical protein